MVDSDHNFNMLVFIHSIVADGSRFIDNKAV